MPCCVTSASPQRATLCAYEHPIASRRFTPGLYLLFGPQRPSSLRHARSCMRLIPPLGIEVPFTPSFPGVLHVPHTSRAAESRSLGHSYGPLLMSYVRFPVLFVVLCDLVRPALFLSFTRDFGVPPRSASSMVFCPLWFLPFPRLQFSSFSLRPPSCSTGPLPFFLLHSVPTLFDLSL